MLALNAMDYSTNTAIFSVSSASEISSLPTATTGATMSNGEAVGPVKPGSGAYTTDGSAVVYTLDGATGEWKEKGAE